MIIKRTSKQTSMTNISRIIEYVIIKKLSEDVPDIQHHILFLMQRKTISKCALVIYVLQNIFNFRCLINDYDLRGCTQLGKTLQHTLNDPFVFRKM